MYTLWLANNQLSSRELLHQETKPNECSTNFDVPQNPSLSYDPKRCKDWITHLICDSNCPDYSFYICLILDVCEVTYQKDRTEDRACYILTSRGLTEDKQLPVSWLHFVSTWPNVCGSMLGLLKHGILITAHNSFKYVCLCVCLRMHMCTKLNKARVGCEELSNSSYWQLWTICHHCW